MNIEVIALMGTCAIIKLCYVLTEDIDYTFDKCCENMLSSQLKPDTYKIEFIVINNFRPTKFSFYTQLVMNRLRF